MKAHTRKICGIYKITNPKGRIYIGQSIDILKRFGVYKNDHVSVKGQTRLHRSFLKYGIDKHKFEIIHQCKVEELNDLEVYYIQLFQCFNSEYGMNLRSGGGVSKMSDESRFKISLSQAGKVAHNKGKKCPGISESKRGFKNPNAKIIIDLNTGIFYDTMKEASFAKGINSDTLSQYLTQRRTNKTTLAYA